MKKRFTRVALISVILVTLVASACHPPGDYIHDCPPSGTIRKHFIDLVNNYRAEKNLPFLYCNAFAQAKGQNHADDMNAWDTGFHTTLENGYPEGYWCWLGENWGMSVWPTGQDDNQIANAIFDAWIASFDHRRIIVEDAAEWIGVGVTKEEGDDMWVSLQMGTPHDSRRCAVAG